MRHRRRIGWSTVGVIATSLLTAAAWAALGYFGAKVLWLAVTAT